MQSVCWEKWGGGLRQAPLPGLLRGWSSYPFPGLRRHSVRYRQQRWMDGQTEYAVVERLGVRHRNILGQVAMTCH